MASGGKYKCTLSPELKKKAEIELHETEETRPKKIQELRKLVLGNKALKTRTDDVFLLRFLRARKFETQKAYQMMLDYYKMKSDNPVIFGSMRPNTVRMVLEDGVSAALDGTDRHGASIAVLRLGKWDTGRYGIETVEKANILTFHKLIEDEGAQVNGLILIVDMKDMGWHHGMQMNPFFARKVAAIYQDCFPARFKAFHILFEPRFFDIMFGIMKVFLKQKMLDRMNVHGDNMETLHEFIDPEQLPSDFGGKLPPLNNKAWMETLMSSEKQFAADEKYGLIEVVPESNKVKNDALEHLPGTFKKLET